MARRPEAERTGFSQRFQNVAAATMLATWVVSTVADIVPSLDYTPSIVFQFLAPGLAAAIFGKNFVQGWRGANKTPEPERYPELDRDAPQPPTPNDELKAAALQWMKDAIKENKARDTARAEGLDTEER